MRQIVTAVEIPAAGELRVAPGAIISGMAWKQ
jgi:hypothetical protein